LIVAVVSFLPWGYHALWLLFSSRKTKDDYREKLTTKE